VRVTYVLHPIHEQAGYTQGGLGLGCDGQPQKAACGRIICAQSMPHYGHYGHISQQLSWQGR
jgi:hypothetical protein